MKEEYSTKFNKSHQDLSDSEVDADVLNTSDIVQSADGAMTDILTDSTDQCTNKDQNSPNENTVKIDDKSIGEYNVV